MAQLRRTGPTTRVEGVGYARQGVIHTVPDDQVKNLLATGEWEELDSGKTEPERVTEPAPSKPAAKKPARKRK